MSAISSMGSKITALAVFLVILLATVAVIPFAEALDASISVKDGEGTSFTLDGPVNKIITIGVGVTATAIGVGALDKITVCDSYSKTNSDTIFDNLRDYIKEGKIAANGNIYSSGKDQLKTDIINASEPTKEGHFDKDKDVIMAVVSPSYRGNLSFLAEEGYKNVMYWSDVSSYDDIIDFVETISKVCNGKIDDKAATMRLVSEKIDLTLEKEKPVVQDAFYVTFSGGTFKVGNTKSITTVMIEAAGGNVITKDDSKSASTIEVNLTDLISKHPDAILFADSQVFNNDEHMKNLRTAVGNDVTIKGLDAIWNNFSIESAKGVWAMAGSMYPELFDGDMPTASPAEDDVMIYVGAAIVALIILLGVSYFFMKTPKRP